MKRLQPVLLFLLSVILTVSSTAKIGSQYQMQLGNPSGSQTDSTNHKHYLIQRDQYAMDYSDEHGEPNWVSWDLTKEDIGSSGRSSFIQDTTLPNGFYQVKTSDYSGSGYDRGHMCPSADRTVSVADNQPLFYMSNMIPQAPDNNQGVWNNFESYCRSLTADGSELLITSGPSLFNGSRVPSNAAEIPGDVWKIVVVVPPGTGTALSRITASTRVIAISIPNIAGIRSDPWQNYITSVSQIEADTGFAFFSNLDPVLAAKLRTVVDGQTVTGSPVIVTQPSSQSAALGGSAVFMVSATGNDPLSYQWFKDGELIQGATGTSLSLNNITVADGGSYDVVVTNGAGSTVSRAAVLSLTNVPPSIVTAPVATTVGAGSSTTLRVVAAGSTPLSYQWRKNGQPVSGATTALLDFTDVQAVSAGSYDVIITNAIGSITSVPVMLSVTDQAPLISTQPVSKTGTVGAGVSFSVVASGTSPLTYQWRKGGVALVESALITGTKTASLSFSALSASDAGSYDVLITNTIGSTTSSAATLTVSAMANLVWDFGATGTTGSASCLPALPVGKMSGGVLTQGNNNGTTTMLSTSSPSSVYGGASGAYNAGMAAKGGSLNKAPGGSSYFEFTLTPDLGCLISATGMSFGSRSTSTGPVSYAVFSSADGYTSPLASGTLTSTSTWALQNPTFTSVTGASGAPVTFRIYGYGSTSTSIAANTAVWRIDDLKVTAVAVQAVPVAPSIVSTSPSNLATGVSIYKGITINFDQPVTLSNDWFTVSSADGGVLSASVTGTTSSYTINPPAGFLEGDTITVTIHAAQVADRATGLLHPSSDYSFSFRTSVATAPTVSSQPANVTALEGGSATFVVQATGSDPFSYQWRKNGSAIIGNASALTASLTLSSLTLADAGSYDCIVTNGMGHDTSAAATLAVNVRPPVIVTQPADQTLAPAAKASFSVVATSGATPTYQWRHGGVALVDNSRISGATGPTLTVDAVSLADMGAYDVVVTNTGGSTTSAIAGLWVSDPSLQAVTWDFSSASPTSGLPSTVTGGDVSQWNNNGTTAMLSTTSASTTSAGFSGGNNAGAAARIGVLNKDSGGSTYFEFTLTPEQTRMLMIAVISVGTRSTSTGPQALAVYSSLDGFANPLGGTPLANNSNWLVKSPAFTPFQGAVGQPITLRIYGYAGTGSPSASTANWRIDDLKVQLKAVATPPVLTSVATNPSLIVGDRASFSVGVAGGTSPVSLQWRRNGVALSGNATAQTSNLVIESVVTADAGTYDCVVTNEASTQTSAASVLTVAKAPVVLTLSGLDCTYDGLAKAVTASPARPVAGISITYDGQTQAPVNAGSYAVSASIQDADYFGTASGTLVIGKATSVLTLGNLTPTYDGSAKAVTVTPSPSVASIEVLYDGKAQAPVNAGTYAVSATVKDPNYAGTASGTLVIGKATSVLTLGNLTPTYDGSAKAVTVSPSPSVAAVEVLYDGNAQVPVNAGTYAVSATVKDPNYVGTASGSLVIGKATSVLTLGNLLQTYDGSPKAVTVSPAPAVAALEVLYNGQAQVPVNAGSYEVSVSAKDPNYVGTAGGTLVIGKATAGLTLGNLQQRYDGTPKSITVATVPVSLTANISYAGSATAPSKLGKYPVIVTVVDSNYQGTASATFEIGMNYQTISFEQPANHKVGDAAFQVTATASSGLPVSFLVVSGPATVSGSTVTLTGTPGTVTLLARQLGNANYDSAADITHSFLVEGGQVQPSPVQSGQVYFGKTSASDSLAAYVTADGSRVTLLGYLASSSQAFIVDGTLGADGNFHGLASLFTGLQGSSSSASALQLDPSVCSATLNVTGTIAGGSITGSFIERSLSFSASAAVSNGSFAGNAGYYTAPALSSATGSTYAILGASGQMYVLAVTPNGVLAGTSTADTAGNFAVAGLNSLSLSGQVHTADKTITSHLVSGSQTLDFAGVQTGTVRSDRLINLSSRGVVTAGQPLIAGFVVGGGSAKRVLVRAVGPTLLGLGVDKALKDPVLRIYDQQGALVLENDNWSAAEVSAVFNAVGAFALAADSKDSSLVATLQPGAYTMHVLSKDGSSGIALAEVYDASETSTTETQRLVNISSRATVGTGEDQLIGGFVVTGKASKRMLIRGCGPSLAKYGVAGFVSNPVIRVVDQAGHVVAINDDWGTPIITESTQNNASAADITSASKTTGAFEFATGSKDAALIVTLNPGIYTVLLNDGSNVGGNALIEIYEML